MGWREVQLKVGYICAVYERMGTIIELDILGLGWLLWFDHFSVVCLLSNKARDYASLSSKLVFSIVMYALCVLLVRLCKFCNEICYTWRQNVGPKCRSCIYCMDLESIYLNWSTRFNEKLWSTHFHNYGDMQLTWIRTPGIWSPIDFKVSKENILWNKCGTPF